MELPWYQNYIYTILKPSPKNLFFWFSISARTKGNIMAKYVPFLSPIRLLANLHKGTGNGNGCRGHVATAATLPSQPCVFAVAVFLIDQSGLGGNSTTVGSM
jgi:hypothetical protein